MKKLIIAGAGGCGREVMQWALDMREANETGWEIEGFIDDNIKVLDSKIHTYGIIGRINGWAPKNDELFVCAIADPEIKEHIVNMLSMNGAEFINIIHPTAIIAHTAQTGKGVIVYPYSVISDNAIIGNHVIVNFHTAIGHDATVGDMSTISAFCDITGNVRVNKRVFISSHVTIIPGRVIGDNAFIGAGSCVVNSVKARDRVFGIPAKKIIL